MAINEIANKVKVSCVIAIVKGGKKNYDFIVNFAVEVWFLT